MSHLMYAYGIRDVGNPELHQKFEAKITEMGDRLDYQSMFNVVYYMLFRGITNKALWEKIVHNTIEQEDVLPLIFYRPFKISEMYLKSHYPDWDLSDYHDKFWHAEFYFDANTLDDNYVLDKEYDNFKAFLTGHCLVYPGIFHVKHNLFCLHYVFEEFKIAINFHLQSLTKSDDSMPSEMQKLPAKMMKLEGWEIYDLSEKEFKSWNYQERVDNIKNWLKAAKQRQIEKGIVPEVEPVYV